MNNSAFLANGNVCCLLITFANSLDPDQDRQNIGPDLDPNRLTLNKRFALKKLILKKISRRLLNTNDELP